MIFLKEFAIISFNNKNKILFLDENYFVQYIFNYYIFCIINEKIKYKAYNKSKHLTFINIICK